MRALTEAERADRRDALADRATVLFAEVGYARLTIEAVAQAAGVAKGSVFLAFSSKEDLVLHAVSRRFELWFVRLGEVLPSVPPRELAHKILASLQADPLLMPLLALVGPVLEQGCSAEAVVRFKSTLATDVQQMAQLWSKHLPHIPQESWGPFFLRIYALIVGAWAVGEASGTVREALAPHPGLHGLLTRFDDLLVPMLSAQLQAILPE